MFIPDPDYFPIPDPGVKKAPDPGSRSATLVVNADLLQGFQILDKWLLHHKDKFPDGMQVP